LKRRESFGDAAVGESKISGTDVTETESGGLNWIQVAQERFM
jgi:hypothetical protein